LSKAKRITSKMVAERAGVSRTAVSFVLNGDPLGKISPETKRRIRKAMQELDYKPNLLARSMRTQKTQTIGIITTGIAEGWFTRIVLGAEGVLREEGYNILLGSITKGPTGAKSMRSSIDLLLSRQVDGLIIITGSEPQDDEALATLIDSGVPAVLVNYYSEQELPFGRVYIGYKKGAIDAVEHLYSLGRRRIAFLAGAIEGIGATGFTKEVYLGYYEGLKKCSLPYLQELLSFRNDGSYSFNYGSDSVERLLNSKPDAIYCLNDHIAFGALSALRKHGVSVPGEIAVVGNDDLEAAKYVDPPLTSIDMMLEDCGELAAGLLLEMLDGQVPASPLYGPAKVKVRASTMDLKD
jgi:LacI family transcriptional regulator